MTGGSTWTVPRPRLSTVSMTRWRLSQQVSVEEEQEEEEETTQLHGLEVVEEPDVPRLDMELLENDCSKHLF